MGSERGGGGYRIGDESGELAEETDWLDSI